MGKFILQNKQQVEDFVTGLTFYGTGGGGSKERGIETLNTMLDKNIEIGWVDASYVEDDDYTICPFLMGSIAPKTEETFNEMHTFGLIGEFYGEKDQLAKAVRALEEIKGKKVKALIPIELGGGNAAACIAASAINGIVTLDGDYTGRAIPEIQQTTPYILEKELLPITTCDAWGNTAIIDNTINWKMAERMGKMIAAASYSLAGEAGFFMTGKDTKEAIIKGTMTDCYELGKFIREEREKGNDPVESAVKKLGGWILTRGKVAKKEWEDKVGYYWGTHTFIGEGAYQGDELKVWFKNENHMCWKNGAVFVTSPDMIIVVDNKTCEPLTNDVIAEGREVAVIGLKARELFRTPRGLDILGPGAFGYDVEYTPIEDKIK